MRDYPIDALKSFICPQCLVYEGEILNYHTLPCSPRVGGEFTPRIYNYIFLPPYPYLCPAIPASRPWFRGHGKKSLQGDYIGAGFEGFTLVWNPDTDSVLFLLKMPANWVPNVCVGFMDPKTLSCRCKAPSLHPGAPLICAPCCVHPDDCVTCPNWSLISTTGDSAVDYTCPAHKHPLSPHNIFFLQFNNFLSTMTINRLLFWKSFKCPYFGKNFADFWGIG